MANYKHKLFKQYKSGNINFDVYNSYKNNLCHKIKNTKKTYFCKMFENCKNDSKKTWKTITSILSNKRKIESHIVLTGDNDEDICDSLEIANKFCNFFSTIVDRLDETIPTTDTDPMDCLPDALPHQFTPHQQLMTKLLTQYHLSKQTMS